MTNTKVPLFSIPNLTPAKFQERPNRFVAIVRIDGNREEYAHVHDPGRLKELLVKGAELLVARSHGKLRYYVKAVKTESEWVLIDTALHNKIAEKLFSLLPEFKSANQIKKEVKIGKSRIDFLIDRVPLEVKGCTLVKDGFALFPDAPTERGARHVEEIIKTKGMILILVFRKAEKFGPNWEMDPRFSEALSNAYKVGVSIMIAQICFDGYFIYYCGKICLSIDTMR